MGNTPTSIYPESNLEELYSLPRKYEVLKLLGQGNFGVVLKCLDQNTKKTVAIKIAKVFRDLNEEASMMQVLMDNNLDQQNIVKFYGGFWMNKYLVFEKLDMSLKNYLCKRKAPMSLQDIRTVIQQLATAFDALTAIGVIHTDVKTTNIMLVDHVRQPLKVKLIDFGLAIFKSNAKHVKIHQTPFFRAPEIMLGLQLSEAIDIWSLGCVMAIMLFGFPLFPGKTDYELLQYIFDLIGPPSAPTVNVEWKWGRFFNRTASNQWILKTPQEYCRATTTDSRHYTFRSLDEMKTTCLEKDNATGADERWECIELLKAMLKWTEKERITPGGILNHPFITMSYLNSSWSEETESSPSQASVPSASPAAKPGIDTEEAAEPCTNQASQLSTNQASDPDTKQARTRTKDTIMRTCVDDNTRRTHRLTSTALPSGFIRVQPAPSQSRIPQEETSEPISKSDTLASTFEEPNTSNLSDNTDDSELKKRKENCLKCYSWTRRTFACCYVDNIQK